MLRARSSGLAFSAASAKRPLVNKLHYRDRMTIWHPLNAEIGPASVTYVRAHGLTQQFAVVRGPPAPKYLAI